MRLLLDTHVLLWWLENPALLSAKAREAIRASENAIYISAAVIWEITIKKSLGKLEIPDDMDDVLQDNHFLPLSVTVAHALSVQVLPVHHRDPFDRMLIAQAIAENMVLITRDPSILKYQISSMPA